MRLVFPTIDTEDFSTPFYRGEYSKSILDNENCALLISSIFKNMNVRALFFVAITERFRVGEALISKIIEQLMKDGHEIGLHTHPIWGDIKGREHLWQLNNDEQREYIYQEKRFMESLTGEKLLGHRAGAYGLDVHTLDALKVNDIPLDSSMFHGHSNCKLTWTMNRVEKRFGILEIPVTGFFQTDIIRFGPKVLRRRRRFIKTDLDGCSFSELKWFLDSMEPNGIEVMNFFMHSYSLLDRNLIYRDFRQAPNTVHKLEKFLTAVIESKGFKFVDCAELIKKYSSPSIPTNSMEVPIETTRERKLISATIEKLSRKY